MDSNNVPVNIYIDLSKAFDTLNHSILLSKLECYGITSRSYDLLKNYLSNRSFLCLICINDLPLVSHIFDMLTPERPSIEILIKKHFL